MEVRRGTILIVDDEESVRSLIKYGLTNDGYDVLEAVNGKEALEVLQDNKIDVVISDIIMPVMDGVELVKRIRIEFPMTRIIMMTGYVNIENLLICVQNQVDTVIFKPFKDMSEMMGAVEHSFEHLQHWQSKLKEFESTFGSTAS